MSSAKPIRRSQAERRAETRAKLVGAARKLFVSNGFAATATPDIVRLASVTRGALYHHFDDKKDLFRAVAFGEADAVSDHIEKRTRGISDPQKALAEGADAYFDAMAVPGRVKILLEDAPAVLGHAVAKELTQTNGTEELREGLKNALPRARKSEINALTNLLSAAFDRAAQDIAHGADVAPYRAGMMRLLKRVIARDSS